MVDFPVLLQALHMKAAEWEGARTVLLFVDTRPLDGPGQPAYWRDFSPWARERCRWVGPYEEITLAAHFPATSPGSWAWTKCITPGRAPLC